MTAGQIIRTIIGVFFGLTVIIYGVNALFVAPPDGNAIDWVLQAAYVALLGWVAYWLLKPLIARLSK